MIDVNLNVGDTCFYVRILYETHNIDFVEGVVRGVYDNAYTITENKTGRAYLVSAEDNNLFIKRHEAIDYYNAKKDKVGSPEKEDNSEE